jgi:hypothetical protein
VTVRVALEALATNLVDEGLGEDEHGLFMVREYLESIKELRSFMYRGERR